MARKAFPSKRNSNFKVTGQGRANKAHNKVIRTLEDLALIDQLTEGVLAPLKRDLASGMTSEQIMKKYAALAAARTVSVAANSADEGKALMASKEIMDRALGKAKETKHVTHAMESASDKELDAVLLSKLKEIEGAIDVTPLSSKEDQDEEN